MTNRLLPSRDHPRADPADVPAEMVELTLLLSAAQADALEAAAACRGLTVGQLLRRLVREVLQTGAAAGLERPPNPLNSV
jgi:hypothetical protein